MICTTCNGSGIGPTGDTASDCPSCDGTGEARPVMVTTVVNGRWPLLLPAHRADRPEWPWWEAQRLAAMHHVITQLLEHERDSVTVYDAGGEEGDFPALWSSWGADVVIAEPNPRVWPNIRAIFDANDLPLPLLCWPGFFGDEERMLEVLVPDGWPECAYGEVIGDHGFCQLNERPDLPATTIDTVVASGWAPPPDVITIDVEGSELHVLEGARTTLVGHRPHVFVSIHPTFMADQYGAPNGVERIRALMLSAGYPDAGDGLAGRYLCHDHEEHWWFPPT